MILQNELDFAVVDNVTVSPHYLVEPLCGEELAAVCAPRLSGGKELLTLAELAEERLLLREQAAAPGTVWMPACRERAPRRSR